MTTTILFFKKPQILKYYILFTALLVSHLLNAQITLTQNDFPSIDDTFRLSMSDSIIGIDPKPTGANFTWDYSFLNSDSQRIDTFVSMIDANILYAFAFIGRASMASRVAFVGGAGNFVFENPYQFYKKSASAYEIAGFGAEIQGFPVPIKYDVNDQEYVLPLNYNQSDSNVINFNIIIPNTVEIYRNQKRINKVDGWGKLKLPNGTFDVLRVRSELIIRDSIVFQGFPLPVIPITNFEYKWLSTGRGLPLLQINTTKTFINESVRDVVYQDIKSLPNSVNVIKDEDQAFNLYPNPVKSTGTIRLDLKEQSGSNSMEVEIFDVTGKLVYQSNMMEQQFNIDLSGIPGLKTGTYFISILKGDSKSVQTLTVY
jgi:Secretion system C-terminal sorting domain